MRPSLLPGLLGAAQRNANRGFADLKLFEVGQVFLSITPEGQHTYATGIRMGGIAPLAGDGQGLGVRRQGRYRGAARRHGP